MRAACHAFIPFCSMHPESLTTRAPLNGDQLCGHVYVADLIIVITVADNRYRYPEIRSIFQAERVPKGTLYLPKVHALISKQF